MDKRFGRERAQLELAGVRGAVAKGHLVVFEFDQAAVADGDPEDIRGKILDGRAAIADRFAMNHPLLLPNGGTDIVGEAGFLQGMLEFGLEDPGEGFDREEEVMAGR